MSKELLDKLVSLAVAVAPTSGLAFMVSFEFGVIATAILVSLFAAFSQL